MTNYLSNKCGVAMTNVEFVGDCEACGDPEEVLHETDYGHWICDICYRAWTRAYDEQNDGEYLSYGEMIKKLDIKGTDWS